MKVVPDLRLTKVDNKNVSQFLNNVIMRMEELKKVSHKGYYKKVVKNYNNVSKKLRLDQAKIWKGVRRAYKKLKNCVTKGISIWAELQWLGTRDQVLLTPFLNGLF